jgi:hypothetical protein
VYVSTVHESVPSVKSMTVLPVSPAEVLAKVTDLSTRKTWDATASSVVGVVQKVKFAGVSRGVAAAAACGVLLSSGVVANIGTFLWRADSMMPVREPVGGHPLVSRLSFDASCEWGAAAMATRCVSVCVSGAVETPGCIFSCMSVSPSLPCLLFRVGGLCSCLELYDF